ncbi:MAG: glycosyltransferase family 39 protein [Mailhella sp.]|nr:glycosyltransferase family 39 protein [Mailhella sp.]
MAFSAERRCRTDEERRLFLWAAAIIFITTAVRAWFIASGPLDLVQDEAQYWDWSRHPQLSYYSKGPLIAWIITLWTGVFGSTEFGVRFGALLGGFLVQWGIWFGCARLFRRPRMGLIALVIAAGMPLVQAVSMLMTTDSPLLLCWTAALFALYRTALFPEEKLPLAVLFLAAAFGNLAKYMMLFMPVTAFLFCLLLLRHKFISLRHSALILAVLILGAAAGYLPILAWNIQNDWVTVRHVAALAGLTGKKASSLLRFDTPFEFLGSSLGIVLPWWLLYMLYRGFAALKTAVRGNDPSYREFCAISGLTGEAASERADTVRCALLSSAFLPLWCGLFAWSFHTRVYPNWCGMSYAAGILLAADGLERLLARAAAGMSVRSARAARTALIANCALFAAALILIAKPLPFLPDPANRLKGWRDMGAEMENLLEKFHDPDRVFFITDYYDMTAEAAFYGPGQPAVYLAYLGGRRLTQYDLWPSPVDPGSDCTGMDALYVTRRDSLPGEIRSMFAEAEVFPWSAKEHGKPGRDYLFAVLRGFNGKWTKTARGRY